MPDNKATLKVACINCGGKNYKRIKQYDMDKNELPDMLECTRCGSECKVVYEQEGFLMTQETQEPVNGCPKCGHHELVLIRQLKCNNPKCGHTATLKFEDPEEDTSV